MKFTHIRVEQTNIMSDIEERKFYLQLWAFTTGPAIDATHMFFEINVLHKTKLETFFNNTNNKHVLFHQCFPETSCCECNNHSIASKGKNGCLNKHQLKILFDDTSLPQPNHEKTIGTKITQHCLCKYSSKCSINIDSLDITLFYAIVQHCCPAKMNCAWLKRIKDVRNFLAHVGNGQVGKCDFETHWKLLENATFGFASELGSKCLKMFTKEVAQIKSCSIEVLKEILKESNDNLIKTLNVLNGLKQQFTEPTESKNILHSLKSEQLQQKKQLERMEYMLGVLTKQRMDNLEPLVSFHDSEQSMQSEKFESGATNAISDSLTLTCEVESAVLDERKALRQIMNTEAKNDGKQFEVDSAEQKCLLLHLKSNRGIFKSEESLLYAITSLIRKIVKAGEIDTSVESSMNVKLTLTSPVNEEERKVICAMLLKYGDLNEKHILNQTRSCEEVNFAIKTECISKTEEGIAPMMFQGTARKRIKQNFCCLKQYLLHCNIDGLIETSYQDKLINYKTYIKLKELTGSVLQVEGILKRVSEADEEKCWKFLHLMAGFTGFNLRTFLKPEKAISEESKQRFKNVEKSCLQKHEEYIKDQLEIKKTLDTMIEYDVITVREHDEIQESKGRRKKVDTFINCVFGKAELDWIPKFLHVLDCEGYSNLVDLLTKTRPFPPIQDLYIPRGQARRFTARVRALPENTERLLLANDGVLVDAAVQSVFSSPLLNLREGSIYLLLNISKDKSLEMRHTATETITFLVRMMLQSIKVKDSITEKCFVLVEIDETDEDAFLNETFDEELILTSVGPKYEKECSRCIQNTIIDSYDLILDEIETDAITETLNKVETVPDFIRHKCIDNMGSLSRTQRVGIFLQYVLTRESMLKTFMQVLVDQEIDVERQMCPECSGIHVKHSSGDTKKKRAFQFQIEKDEYGEIIVQYKDILQETDELELGHGKAGEHLPIEVTVVAAIDIGTSYSGYAYSTVKAYQTDHLDITCNQSWSSRGKQVILSKTPSCILMTTGKELVSFGYDAEKEYESIIAEGNEESYYFFDKFKMSLHETKLEPEQIEIRDVRDHAVAAIDVFALAIKALKENLEQHLIKRIEFSRENIRWVLTVPGLRDFNAEEFMKKCAEKVGIRREQLTIAKKPDAASMYYLYKNMTAKPKMDNKYMVIDVGGGMFDVSVHEVVNENHLRQLCSPAGGPYGGTTVNEHFLEILTEIVGPDVMKSLKTEHSGSYLEIMREFDCAKRVKLTKHNRKTINFTFPITILNRLCNRYCHRHFQQMIKVSKHKNNISIVGDKLRIVKETMYSFFVTSIDEIVKEISRILKHMDSEVKNILLVGGFAECELLQDKIRKSFPEKVLVVFDESDLVVLKGAVLFGHQPHIIDRII